MLYKLKGELIKRELDPVAALKNALGCSESTARNKLRGKTAITVPEAFKIVEKYFKESHVDFAELFRSSA